MIGTCIVCGAYNDGSHKCNEKTENRIEGGRRSHDNRYEYPASYGTRLAVGFDALNGEYNDDD